MKKFIAMLLMAAFLFTGAIGCEGEKKAEKPKEKAGATPEKPKTDK